MNLLAWLRLGSSPSKPVSRQPVWAIKGERIRIPLAAVSCLSLHLKHADDDDVF